MLTLQEIKYHLELQILATHTGDLRNKLTEANIALAEALIAGDVRKTMLDNVKRLFEEAHGRSCTMNDQRLWEEFDALQRGGVAEDEIIQDLLDAEE